jgi:hypothetical protein
MRTPIPNAAPGPEATRSGSCAFEFPIFKKVQILKRIRFLWGQLPGSGISGSRTNIRIRDTSFHPHSAVVDEQKEPFRRIRIWILILFEKFFGSGQPTTLVTVWIYITRDLPGVPDLHWLYADPNEGPDPASWTNADPDRDPDPGKMRTKFFRRKGTEISV